MNFYPIDKGEILINGLNIKDINLECLRDRISYISQETFLFNKTIYENLTFGSSFVPYDEVIEACKKAQIHDYINSIPLRYDTLVEENGANFSGGTEKGILMIIGPLFFGILGFIIAFRYQRFKNKKLN